MKIGQFTDTKVDQNEIESKYLWNYTGSKDMNRINLSTLTLDFSWKFPDDYSMTPYMALPNNQIYWIGIKISPKSLKSQFIIDRNSKIKVIQIQKNYKKPDKGFFTSCYYENSIFTFEFSSDNAHATNLVKRYLMPQDKWLSLCPLPFKSLISCIGFNKKILISSNFYGNYWIWVYDILLDSYSNDIPINNTSCIKNIKTMIKNEGKIYLTSFFEIYVTEDPLSEWTFVSYYVNQLVHIRFSLKVLYEGAIYYLNKNDCSLYEFNLTDFTSKAVLVKIKDKHKV